MKQCRRCRGSGVDPDLKQRYTTGGHNDRSCKECNGSGERDSAPLVVNDEDVERLVLSLASHPRYDLSADQLVERIRTARESPRKRYRSPNTTDEMAEAIIRIAERLPGGVSNVSCHRIVTEILKHVAANAAEDARERCARAAELQCDVYGIGAEIADKIRKLE